MERVLGIGKRYHHRNDPLYGIQATHGEFGPESRELQQTKGLPQL